MKRGSTFGLVAMIPAALAITPAAASASLTMMICTGDGTTQTVVLPLKRSPASPSHQPCCAKGCHAGGSRKRSDGKFDTPQ